jgi:hypothetical protein
MSSLIIKQALVVYVRLPRIVRRQITGFYLKHHRTAIAHCYAR